MTGKIDIRAQASTAKRIRAQASTNEVKFNEMIKKQQLALNRLQERLKEMREEYLTYQRMIEQMKNNLKTDKVEEIKD